MTKEEFVEECKEKGWVPDVYGHLKSNCGRCRMKIQARTWRLEKKVDAKPPRWIRIAGAYYGKTKRVSVGVYKDKGIYLDKISPVGTAGVEKKGA